KRLYYDFNPAFEMRHKPILKLNYWSVFGFVCMAYVSIDSLVWLYQFNKGLQPIAEMYGRKLFGPEFWPLSDMVMNTAFAECLLVHIFLIWRPRLPLKYRLVVFVNG